jgi:TolA-binding protein
MAKQKEPAKTQIEEFDLDEFRDQAVGTFEKYKNLIYGGILLIVLIAGGFYVYTQMYMGPRKENANNEIFRAQRYFEIDSFQLALNGRQLPGQQGNFMGFLDIIQEFGGTPAANTAHYYAGASLLHIGKYEEAIKYLKAYSGKDGLTQSAAYAMIGDAQSELGQKADAISMYLKAADNYPNPATSPIYLRKAGLLSELEGKAEEALKYYERVENEYPQTAQTMNISKDIIRVGGQ